VVLDELLRKGRLVRTLGVDDAPFKRGQRQSVLVVGAICAGTRFEGLLSTNVRPDGFKATERLIELIGGSKFADQLHAVLLNGVTLAGFNIVDLQALHRALALPVIAVMRRYPDRDAVLRVIDKLSQPAKRRRVLDRAGPIHHGDDVFFQVQGAEAETVKALLARVTDRGHIPESLRLAHLIGGGIVMGESGRRA
jgi:endonuclease V-like protein UPF0215 family